MPADHPQRGFHVHEHTEEMLQLGIKRLDRSRAHLFNETVIAVQQLAVISGIPLMGTPMNMQGVI